MKFVLKRVLFSKNSNKKLRAIDEEFLKDQEARKKYSRKRLKVKGTVVGSIAGSYPGMMIGGPAGVIVGTSAGAAAGYLSGKKLGEISDKRFDKFREEYENADPEARDYLREKLERRLDKHGKYRTAIAAAYLAGK